MFLIRRQLKIFRALICNAMILCSCFCAFASERIHIYADRGIVCSVWPETVPYGDIIYDSAVDGFQPKLLKGASYKGKYIVYVQDATVEHIEIVRRKTIELDIASAVFVRCPESAVQVFLSNRKHVVENIVVDRSQLISVLEPKSYDGIRALSIFASTADEHVDDISKCANLTHLDINVTTAGPALWTALSMLPSLQVLYVRVKSSIEMDGFAEVVRTCDLVDIRLDAVGASIVSRSSLSMLKNEDLLKRISLEGLALGDEDILWLHEKSGLESLSLNENRAITLKCVMGVIENNIRTIKTLSVRDTSVSEDEIHMLRTKYPSLAIVGGGVRQR